MIKVVIYTDATSDEPWLEAYEPGSPSGSGPVGWIAEDGLPLESGLAQALGKLVVAIKADPYYEEPKTHA